MTKLISQSCGELQPTVCLSRGCGAIWRRPKYSWTSETSHSKSSPSNFQHHHWPKLLVNVYVYHLMVKSVSCCCVRGSRPTQIQSHLCLHVFTSGFETFFWLIAWIQVALIAFVPSYIIFTQASWAQVIAYLIACLMVMSPIASLH